MTFAYVWEYRVRDDRVDEFRRTYGPRGDWAQLFRRAEGYVHTELFRDVDHPARFITTDVWKSKRARDAFRERFREEFDALDERCETLTVEERHIGDFDVV